MPYTEIKSRNNKKYFYRVLSVRQGRRVNKKRIYLGADLPDSELAKKETSADEQFKAIKVSKTLDSIKEKIIPILKKSKVKKAGIFGSYARGEQRKNSDIDILIQPPKDMGLSFFALERELGEKLKRKVDLITYNGIYHLLRKRILNDEVRLI